MRLLSTVGKPANLRIDTDAQAAAVVHCLGAGHARR